MRTLHGAETDRLRVERWNHAAHGQGLAAVNAHPDVARFLGGGAAIPPTETDELSARLQAHWETYGFGLWAAR